jgi:hypothetical protein
MFSQNYFKRIRKLKQTEYLKELEVIFASF